jgi:DNA-binding transcriptional LysR family regulator
VRLEQLEYIAAVVRHGSLRRASEELHISQPALSEAVSKLERELGVNLLERKRSGARISPRGQELQQFMSDVLDAADRLRDAAGRQSLSTKTLRLGTVSTAMSSLLAPALRTFRSQHPEVTVEVLNTQQSQIFEGLTEASYDLGLINLLPNEEPPVHLHAMTLATGRPVAVLPMGHRLAGHSEVTVDELRSESFVGMRAGYAMHHFVHRLFGSDLPSIQHTADGAELGKLMVADGLGVTVLPEFSVINDPLERAGLITYRPITDVHTSVRLAVVQRRDTRRPQAVSDLYDALVDRARRNRRATDAAATA